LGKWCWIITFKFWSQFCGIGVHSSLPTFGLGAVAISSWLEAVLMIATSMVSASYILKDGIWSKGPTKDWAEGVSLAAWCFLSFI
jgi:hypothetical protein